MLRALTLAVDGTQAGELHSVSRLNTEPLPSACREQSRSAANDPKEPFASPESGHSNSDKLTFAGEVGGTP